MNPDRTALILLGYQNDYFAPNGLLRGEIADPNRAEQVLANTIKFIRPLLITDMTMVSTSIAPKPQYRTFNGSMGLPDPIRAYGALRPGTPGADTIPEIMTFGRRIQHLPCKLGFNAFSNPDLLPMLVENSVTHVLVAGIAPYLCLDSTGRAAHERGFKVGIISDCCLARSREEYEFFHDDIFPLYARVRNHRETIRQLLLEPVEA